MLTMQPQQQTSRRRPRRFHFGCCLAVGETVILLHPPSIFSRCFNRDGESAPAKWQSRRRLMLPSAPPRADPTTNPSRTDTVWRAHNPR